MLLMFVLISAGSVDSWCEALHDSWCEALHDGATMHLSRRWPTMDQQLCMERFKSTIVFSSAHSDLVFHLFSTTELI